MLNANILAVRNGQIEELTLQGETEEAIRKEAILAAAKAFRIDDEFANLEDDERLDMLEGEMDVFRVEILPEAIKPAKHDNRALDAMFDDAEKQVPKGTMWFHQKTGGIYITTGHGVDTATGEMMVSYRPVDQPKHLFHRKMTQWLDTANGEPRFRQL